MLYCTELMFLKEFTFLKVLMLIREVLVRSALFATIGIFRELV